MCVCVCVRLFETPMDCTHQAPLSMRFSRQGYWSGLPFPPPEDLLDSGIKPVSPVSPALAGRFYTTEPPKRMYAAAAVAKSLQSCPTLCDPIDGSPPGSPSLDSPGKNTGVGCHFRLQCVKVKSKSQVAQSCPTLHDPMDCSLPGSTVPGIL